jgi:hypothetical protein
MPEQISKYPDVTLQVLRESGAVCGQGAPQNILKQIPKMTQVTTEELAKVVCPQARKAASFSAGLSALEAAVIFAVFLSGVSLGKLWRWRWH